MDKCESCPCKRVKCERYGDCEACREHHKTKRALPACDREKAKAEKVSRKKSR